MAGGSYLLAQEYFERGDSAFVGELLRCPGGKRMRRFAVKWAEDKRDFARKARVALADRAIDRGDGRVIVKVLFKAAEQRGDDIEVVHHLVAFDRLLRRTPQQIYGWNHSTGQYGQVWGRVPVPRQSARDRHGVPNDFSLRTRCYLQRRAFRYLRRLWRRSPERFLNAALLALSLYDEDHFPAPDSILDNRTLCLLLYGRAPQLLVSGRSIVLRSGNLGELQPAPRFEDAWRSLTAFETLLQLVVAAKSGFVRQWCVSWLKQAHGERLAKLPLPRLRPLLASHHGEAQTLGAELLASVGGWSELPVADWLQLASLDNPQALAALSRLMKKHLSPERLSLAQCLQLTKSRVMPIAELGLRWAMDKGLRDDEAIGAANAIADAETDEVRRRGMEWLRPTLLDRKHSMLLRDLVDSRHRDVREVALSVSGEPLYATDTRVHAAMAESPYGDVTDALAGRMRDWKDKLDEGSLHHLWATILLGVRRGSHAKRATLRILVERAMANPYKAPDLLPLVAVALRSVREAERRAALAALARAAFASPALAKLIAEHIPELSFEDIPEKVAS